MDDPIEPPLAPTRRQIVLTIAGGLAAAGTAAAALSGCGVRKPGEATITSGLVSIGSQNDYPAGTVSTEYQKTYGIVISNDSGNILAIRPKCTHMGCIAPWNPDTHQFECPCHGSRFNALGQPIHGPAQRPLAALRLTPAPDGALAVDLDRLYKL